MGRSRSLVQGVGINDSNYVVRPSVVAICPFYRAWSDMLRRCYSEKYQIKKPSYIGCYVCDEWLVFSNFKLWMSAQDWHGKELDKDLLFVGNKLYSPDTCVFVDSMTNNFTTDHAQGRGLWPIGVDFYAKLQKYRSQCSNPITGKREHIGFFNCPIKAHKAWINRKHEIACQLADLQSNDRVSAALRCRYIKTGRSS